MRRPSRFFAAAAGCSPAILPFAFAHTGTGRLTFGPAALAVIWAGGLAILAGIATALRKSRLRSDDHKHLLDNAPIGIYRTAPDGKILLANLRLAQMLGYPSVEELLSHNLEREGFESGYARLKSKEVIERDGEVKGLEYVWKRRDGSSIHVRENATVVRDRGGQVLYYQGTVEDVSDRKIIEEALATERDFLGALMDSIPDTIYFKDLETRFTRINQAQAKLLGLKTTSEAIGKTDFDFADTAEASYADDKRVLTSGAPVLDRIERCTNFRGQTCWLSTTKVPIRSADGTITGMVGISRDVTERKLADESFSRGLEQFRAQIAKVSDGDLTARGRVDNDVVGEITCSVNKMLEGIASMIGRVKQMGLAVSSSAAQILAASEQIAAGSGRQADEITNTSSTVEEMAASMSQVAKNADFSADAAKQALSMAEAGEKSVHDTFEAMARIRQAVDATSQRMKSLAQRSSEISEIMDLINDIAAQTNLLSLNAAIEAAHAGDAGLGFSVVAEEIRKLAERSSRATRDVSIIIKAIQEESAAAQSAMDLGTEEVAAGAAMSEQARQSLQNIYSVVKHSSELIDEISASAEEQAKVTRNLARAMQVISNITLETSAGAHETAQTLQGMASLAEQLNEVISQFRV